MAVVKERLWKALCGEEAAGNEEWTSERRKERSKQILMTDWKEEEEKRQELQEKMERMCEKKKEKKSKKQPGEPGKKRQKMKKARTKQKE